MDWIYGIHITANEIYGILGHPTNTCPICEKKMGARMSTHITMAHRNHRLARKVEHIQSAIGDYRFSEDSQIMECVKSVGRIFDAGLEVYDEDLIKVWTGKNWSAYHWQTAETTRAFLDAAATLTEKAKDRRN